MANLREIYQYFQNPNGPQNPLNTPNTSEMSDADFYASLAERTPSYQYQGTGDRGPQFGIAPGSFLENLQRQYAGAFSFDPGTREVQWDFSKLPQTRFGPVNRTVGVESYTPLRNRSYVTKDDNYGEITPTQNLRRDHAWVGPLLMALVGAGMGQVAGMFGGGTPWRTASTALRTLRTVGSGLDRRG